MSHLRRLCSLVAVGTLTATGLTALVAAPARAADTDPRPVSIGASWLEGQLTNGLLPGDFGPLYGQSIDAGLSLADLGGHDTTVGAIRDAIAAAIDDGHYITGEEFGDVGSTYAGAVAKSAVFAEESGDGATTLGGVDLIERLEAQVSATAQNDGRLFDTSTFGDFANTLGQAFAARALSNSPSTRAADAVAFLLQQQCGAGYFRADFADSADADQSCDAGSSQGESDPSIDATAIATQQLQAIDDPSGAVDTAVAEATSWLLSQQHADGSFSADQQLGPNSDSTGVAGIVLAQAGKTAAAVRAASWVRAHQADEPTACPNRLSSETGAIGYDADALATGRSGGIGGGQQWRIATAQALPVLRWAPAAAARLALTGPTDFVKAGSASTYRVAGAAPGDKVCVSGMGAAHRVVVPDSGSFSLSLVAPAGTARRIVTASVRAGSSACEVVSVLGAKKLRVVPRRYTVHRHARLRVVVRRLEPGEHVKLRFRGHRVRAGIAKPSGRYVTHIRVGRKLGKARIVARGEFGSIRHGRAIIRVVR